VGDQALGLEEELSPLSAAAGASVMKKIEKAIATLIFFGALFGLSVTVLLLIQTGFSWKSLMIGGFFVFAAVSAGILWKRSTFGFVSCLFLEALQIVTFQIEGWFYKVQLGPSIELGPRYGKYEEYFSFKGEAGIVQFSDSGPDFIRINIIALGLFLLLFYRYLKTQRSQPS